MAICLSDFHTKTTSKTLGGVELKHISCADQDHIQELFRSVKDDRQFALQTLHRQLVAPKLDFQEFECLPEDELRQLARDYSRGQLRQSLDDIPDAQVFFEFRNAVDNKIRKDLEELSATFRKMELGLSDQLARTISGLNYNPALDSIKAMADMERERINNTLKNLRELTTPNIAEIAGLASSTLVADLCKPTALEQSVKGFSLSSQLEKAIESVSLTSHLEEAAREFSLSSKIQEIASAMSVSDRIAEHQKLLSKQILESVSGQLGWTTKLASELLMPQIKAIQSWTAINPDTFSKLTSFWEEFEHNYHIAEYKAVRVLKKYNWFVSPSLPSSFVYEAVKLGRKKGNKLREMNGLFWDYFSDNDFENLTNMVESWSKSPLFKRRMKILRDCVATLKQAKRGSNPSNVVVPTLIAQIDGVLTKFRRQKGLVFKTHGSANQLQELRVWFEAEATNQDVLSEQMLELANYILFSILFQTARYEKPLAIPFTLSRHKIMHGEFLTYGRRANVIRAFLILDFLAALK